MKKGILSFIFNLSVLKLLSKNVDTDNDKNGNPGSLFFTFGILKQLTETIMKEMRNHLKGQIQNSHVMKETF